MCGRFTLYTDINILAERFIFDPCDLREQGSFVPSYNIAPSQRVMVVTKRSNMNVNRVEMMRWGLKPAWLETQSSSELLINARSETISEKPSFQEAFSKRRCLILSDGFYEWENTTIGKRPTRVQMRETKPFAFAGIWEPGRDNSGNHDSGLISSCAILTTQASKFMKPIHNRMPIILKPQNEQKWTNNEITERKELENILSPVADKYMEAWHVSQFVNSTHNNEPLCIERELKLL